MITAARIGALRAAWRAAGVEVHIDASAENCMRMHPDGPRVEAQGLPNLIHEFVHWHHAGVIADDHGFDYRRVPLTLERPDDLESLWDEAAACVISARYCGPNRDVGVAWFYEQIEIQPVFFGLEAKPRDFLEVLRRLVHAHRRRVDEITAGAQAALRITFAMGGVEPEVARPDHGFELPELLEDVPC